MIEEPEVSVLTPQDLGHQEVTRNRHEGVQAPLVESSVHTSP